MRPRNGTTLVEQLVILVILSIVAALAMQRIGALLDGIAVKSAAREVKDVFANAREYAVAAGVRTAVQIEPSEARIGAYSFSDTIATSALGQLHGVTLSSSRDSMAYSPSGLGYGASNLRLILARRAAAETITVSRLGRVR